MFQRIKERYICRSTVAYEEAFIKIVKIQSVSDRTSPCIGTWRPLSLLQIHKSIFCLVSVRRINGICILLNKYSPIVQLVSPR